MTEEEKRKHRCCFTGHRPEKINAPIWLVREQLQKEIRQAIAQGYTTFISGMSRGVDLWAAQIVLAEREKNPKLKLICAIPFPGFEQKWTADWKLQFEHVLTRADLVKHICQEFSMVAYQVRNRWMVHHSALLIAAYTGVSGGTRNTIEYAKKTGKCEIRYLIV